MYGNAILGAKRKTRTVDLGPEGERQLEDLMTRLKAMSYGERSEIGFSNWHDLTVTEIIRTALKKLHAVSQPKPPAVPVKKPARKTKAK